MLDVLAPLILGLVCLCLNLFIWFRVRTNYERWRTSPLFFSTYDLCFKRNEKIWRITLVSSLILMDIMALIIIFVFILGKFSFYE